MHSCLYEGTVSHHRHEPVTHRFRYRLFMALLDLDELSLLVGQRALISNRRRAACSFLRSDHLFNSSQTLAAEVRDIIYSQTGENATGPIRVLTQLRYFGFYFSPINLFYVYNQHDTEVLYIVAEVNNTPWKERHCYVLWDGNRTTDAGDLGFSHPKEFHVSPFMGMDMQYRWALKAPGDQLSVHLANLHQGRRTFTAGVKLVRRELSPARLRYLTTRYPFLTAQISVAIYYQALKLWWKRCPAYVHPKKLSPSPSR